MNKLMLKRRFNLTLSDNMLRIWSEKPIIVMKNSNSIQIVETKIKDKRCLIINIHLDCKISNRKKQIKDLADVIDFLLLSYSSLNLICTGDFKSARAKLKDIKLHPCCSNDPTWRKSKEREYTTKIDYVFYTGQMNVGVELVSTESDHKALCCRIKSIRRFKGNRITLVQSNLSKRKTIQSCPWSWTKYPEINIQGYLGPNKTRMTIPSVVKLNEYIKKEKERISKSVLISKEEWQRVLKLTNIKPYQKFQPIIDSNGKPVLRIQQYIETVKKNLQECTSNAQAPYTTQILELKDYKITTVVNGMIENMNKISPRKSCGNDGIYPY